MPTIYTFQPADRVDGIDGMGNPRYQRPYPYHVLANGEVQQKGFWGTTHKRLVGFQNSYLHQRLDLIWGKDVAENPELCVGKYAIFVDGKGQMFNIDTPVESIVAREMTDEQLEHLNE